jgi:KamA family protein
MKNIPEDIVRDIEIVGSVLPFKSNSYVVNELINWDSKEQDPMFTLTFPRKGMLKPEHYERMKKLFDNNATKQEIKEEALKIRYELNPHPAGQRDKNVPEINGQKIEGMQHKYVQTALFFPKEGQTCHAYCTFCFRWAQFIGDKELRFAQKDAKILRDYLMSKPDLTDVLFTGGDPMVMPISFFKAYIEEVMKVPHIKNIRIGSKSLTFWPYRYLTDKDSEEVLELFRTITAKKNLAFMAHFNHPVELSTDAVKQAVKKIQDTGAVIRTQSPLLNNINAEPEIWKDLWERQIDLNLIPYYMFVARDTGAQHYYAVGLEKAHEIFQKAYSQVSGIARTVRGPSMSADPGKVQISGTIEIQGEKYYVLSFIQARDPEWVGKPFLAKYDPKAVWLTDLKPAFGDKFFYED